MYHIESVEENDDDVILKKDFRNNFRLTLPIEI